MGKKLPSGNGAPIEPLGWPFPSEKEAFSGEEAVPLERSCSLGRELPIGQESFQEPPFGKRFTVWRELASWKRASQWKGDSQWTAVRKFPSVKGASQWKWSFPLERELACETESF